MSPYLVLMSGGYTKHFYIEAQRITSKLGSGNGADSKGDKAGGDQVNYPGRQDQVREGIVRNLKFLGQDGALLTAGKSGKTPPGQIIGEGSGGNSGGKDTESFLYYFHPDHLGSSSYITDASGEVYQHLEYFAFGETFVEEHSNTNRTPYLFNGKELDEETGLYYYRARYYDPRTSVWMSVDPLAEKYPSISAYAYTFNNPLNFIDPTGMEGIEPDAKTMAKLSSDVYQTHNGQYKKGAVMNDLDGYTLSKKNYESIGVTLTDDKSGFNSAVYEKKIDGKMQYVYVTQGSDFDNGGNDWSENYNQSMGQFSQQYKTSTDNARKLQQVLGDNLSFAGHSLGGGLASANALATGLSATTFNAAGLHKKSSSLYGLNKVANITAYVVNREAVHMSQKLLGLRAEGKIVTLPASYLSTIPYAPPKVNAGIIGINVGISLYNHTMGAVMSKMGIK